MERNIESRFPLRMTFHNTETSYDFCSTNPKEFKLGLRDPIKSIDYPSLYTAHQLLNRIFKSEQIARLERRTVPARAALLSHAPHMRGEILESYADLDLEWFESPTLELSKAMLDYTASFPGRLADWIKQIEEKHNGRKTKKVHHRTDDTCAYKGFGSEFRYRRAVIAAAKL